MKKFFFLLSGVFIAGGLFLIVLLYQSLQRYNAETAAELAQAGKSVAARLDRINRDIGKRLSVFAKGTASDQMFSLRLLAENNPTALEVTGRAAEFIGPMGFSLLDITDAAGVIVSSGSLVASVGNSAAEKLSKLSEAPCFIRDKVVGAGLLTLQAKSPIIIADSIRFFALGGMIVDSAFLAMLSPGEGVIVLLKQDNSITGLGDIRKISEVKNGRIIIKDKKYPAIALSLPMPGKRALPN